MAKALLVCLLVITTSFAFKVELEELKAQGFKRLQSTFGDVAVEKVSEHITESVLLNRGNVLEDPILYEAFLNDLLAQLKTDRSNEILKCSKGKASEFFKFGAVEVGCLGNKSDHESIVLDRREDDCFGKVTVNFTRITKNSANDVVIELKAEDKLHPYCNEGYVLGTGANFHVTGFTLKNHHKFTWKNLNEVELNNILTWGIHVFRLCDEVKHWLPNVIKTVEIFLGGVGDKPNIPFFGSKPPRYMQELNVNFIEAGTGYRWKHRNPVFTDLDETEVKSGDFLAITRLDGIDQIIQYGAGSHSGHSAMLLEVDGVLNVVESQDGWYWPKHGIQRNTWKQWKKWAQNADFNVAVLPMTTESRKKFNVTAGAEFFKQMEGFPYGYHNFLFGWIDTIDQNLPPVLDKNLIMVVFSLLERLWEYPIKRILTESLNMRLGTKNMKMADIAIEISKRNMTLADLMAQPEIDGFYYSDGPSYVCSSFVAAVYRAGGLLPNDVQGTEMTPRDVYTMNIYDLNYQVPEKCKVNDPTLPYCQIMGHYLMELPGYAQIEPYSHMSERCPTMAPEFFRPEGC